MPDRTLTWLANGAAPTVPAAEGARYLDLGFIGAGATGEVRRVHDRLLDCVVAMKILAPDRRSEAARAWFVAEATVTARLRHPGVVAIHDRGEREDGALWYTMNEIRGRTFASVLELPPTERLRQGVDTLVRVCDALAHAHAQGIVHRDLKPDNVMLGEFGSVLVVDWGLAGRVGDPPEARGVGTPGWVAPEQARGDAPAPTADVYALGSLLHAVLVGRPPRVGPATVLWAAVQADPPRVLEPAPDVPSELAALCRAATEPDPGRRPRDAGEVGAALAAWRERAARRAEADRAFEIAMRAAPAIAELRLRAAAARAEARAQLEALPAYSPSNAKEEAWAREDAAAADELAAAVAETRWLEALGAVLQGDPDHPAAHDALADHHAAALLRAEAERRPSEASRSEILLRAHTRGRHAALLQGDGAVTLVTDPPGAEVLAFRYVERGRRLVAEPWGTLGRTPLREVRLPRGSWLLELHREGHAVVRYPVLLGRGESWDGVRPGGTNPFPIRLPTASELGPDDCLVSAGWCRVGGDPGAVEPLPYTRVWVDGLVVRRFPVRLGELRGFLAGSGRRAGHPGDRDELAARSISWETATAYAAWMADRTGLGWRLPDEVEWEKAGRGVDGRRLPCGDHLEPTWFNVLGAAATAREVEPPGLHPADESPYGVRDLVGNVVDWCANGWRADAGVDPSGLLRRGLPLGDLRVGKGGSYAAADARLFLASRSADRPDRTLALLGLRLVRDYA